MSQVEISLNLDQSIARDSSIVVKDSSIVELLRQKDFRRSIQEYEQLIESDSDNPNNYLYLGLLYLLNEQEESAQATWFYLLSQVNEDQNLVLSRQLTQVLDAAARYYQQIGDVDQSYMIRSCLYEFNPTYINNIIERDLLAVDAGGSLEDLIEDSRLIILLANEPEDIDPERLLQIFKAGIAQKIDSLAALASACIPHTHSTFVWQDILLDAGYELTLTKPEIAIDLCQICLQLSPTDPALWFAYAYFCSNQPDPQRSISAAYAFKEHCLTSYWKVRGCYAVVRELTEAGHTLRAAEAIPELKATLLEHIQETLNLSQSESLSQSEARNFSVLIIIPGILQYFQDNPQETRYLQNQIARRIQALIDQSQSQSFAVKVKDRKQAMKRLKIGYIGHTLRKHSVGWLCRWILQYHDHDQFHITTYYVGQQTEEFFTEIWFSKPADASFCLPNDVDIVSQKIREDEIDILIDVDSMTFQSTCAIMASRSAPVQATWLGFDACGLPAIDYFIADPLVLPDHAQDYYQEKIWRLPETYIAVEGFEVGIPNISRDSLNISQDAIIYYSSQAGSKRNLANIRLQMQILKGVPNSILLVKGNGDQNVIHDMFSDAAREIGISLDQIRFLQKAPTEFVHRANMRVADVILDTFPYTGATTTLEALWMGMPVVTKVGQQFAARNSYAFITNAGIQEGIAYTDQEYIEWGMRLGLERDLRHKIIWQLRQSRQTSPLWDAQRFTRHMEAAYRQMWEIYCQS
jgi:predicted O-linked N-acetylglucosamine transferase (SPINDLY family)